eukprot:Nitzschia sp. Nitz4//scaffold5_size260463//86691//87548//NITZ4_000969-RA/size260463-processed-gene-0.122-mRNA-1//-1//CDS//3329555301//744//frame0
MAKKSSKKEESEGEEEEVDIVESDVKEEDVKNDENDEEGATGGKRKRKRKRKKKAAETQEEETEPEGAAQSQDSVECTVFVEGIPFDATSDKLKEFFASNGDINDIIEMRLPTWQDSGRLRGFGHVLFGSKASYDKALTLSGTYLGKRFLTIQPANSPKGGNRPARPSSSDPPPKDCKTLFVNNLPYGATEEEIASAFEKVGGTVAADGVRIARNSVTRQSKGFCYVEFETPKDAQKVVKSTADIKVGGRVLRLDYDTGRMKGSYRAESGRLWTKESRENKRART